MYVLMGMCGDYQGYTAIMEMKWRRYGHEMEAGRIYS